MAVKEIPMHVNSNGQRDLRQRPQRDYWHKQVHYYVNREMGQPGQNHISDST